MTSAPATLRGRSLHLARRPHPRPLITSGDLQELIDDQGTSSASPPTPRSSPRRCPRATPTTPRSRTSPRTARTSTRRSFARSRRTTCATRATSCCRCTRRPAARTAACRSRSTRASPPTRTRPSRRPRRCARRSTGPTCIIKIPATVEGLPAISQALAEGISVNVTLIFSLDRYRGVMNAFLTGLEQARRPATTCPRSTRSPRSSSPASTPRSTSAWTRSAPTRPRRSRARPAWPTPAWPTRPTRRSSPPRAGSARGRGCAQAAPAVGVHRRQGPRLPRHDVRR